MKYKHPDLGTTSTILKMASQLVGKSVRPGESVSSIQRKIELMVKFLEEKNGILNVSDPGPIRITDEDMKVFASLASPRERATIARNKARNVVSMKSR